jgi:hypothetical protein
MKGHLLAPPEFRLECPNCDLQMVVNDPRAVLHQCRGLHGLTTPMLPAGTKAKVEAVEREDYIGGDDVQLDPERGRPVMSVVTTRDDGQDVTSYAPCATATRDEVLDALTYG